MRSSDELMQLATTDGAKFVFRHVELHFEGDQRENVFALKNNKSLGETLRHKRYAKLADHIKKREAQADIPLGQFLAQLKIERNELYKLFLNPHGDKVYTTFSITDPEVLCAKGLYAYYVGEELHYIGRCRDNMKKRINQGYGKIHPKNCYIDGQSTNCHLNSRITEVKEAVSLWFCAMSDDDEINSAEAQLIRHHCPAWNVQRL